MILTLAIFIGLLATFVRSRLTNRTLKFPKLRLEWLVFVAVIPQVLTFYIPIVGQQIPESMIPAIQFITMLGLLVFTSVNLLRPGFWMLGLGLFSNFLVIFLNGGWMPILPETLHRMVPTKPLETWEVGTRLGTTKDRIFAYGDVKLFFLSDQFTMPQWFPYQVAFSLGDIFITIGVVILLWSLSRKREE